MTQHTAHIKYHVPYAETDQMGVVYYANYLVYFERVRTTLLRGFGLSYKQMEKNGYALPVVQAYIEYKKPAEYEDVLDIYGELAWAEGVRVRINCEVRREGILLAHGYTVHACVDTKSGRPVRIPPALAECCERKDSP